MHYTLCIMPYVFICGQCPLFTYTLCSFIRYNNLFNITFFYLNTHTKYWIHSTNAVFSYLSICHRFHTPHNSFGTFNIFIHNKSVWINRRSKKNNNNKLFEWIKWKQNKSTHFMCHMHVAKTVRTLSVWWNQLLNIAYCYELWTICSTWTLYNMVYIYKCICWPWWMEIKRDAVKISFYLFLFIALDLSKSPDKTLRFSQFRWNYFFFLN